MQAREQLLEPQLDCETLQLAPWGHMQLAPVQMILLSLPQPTQRAETSGSSRRIFMGHHLSPPIRPGCLRAFAHR